MFTTLLVACLFGTTRTVRAQEPPAATPAVRIEFFYEPSCEECKRVTQEVLPDLQTLYTGLYTLIRLDVSIETNYLRLAAYQEKLGVRDNAPVSMVLNGTHWIGGFTKIKSALFPAIDHALTDPAAVPPDAGTPAAAPVLSAAEPTILQARYQRFTLAGVLLAGLVDGINPCAFSTLIFFMSLLSLSRSRGNVILLAGGSFCLANFVTYFIIGFGLLHALRALSAVHGLRLAIDVILTVVLMVFALLSFRDAWTFHRHKNPDDVSLSLPKPVVKKIHEIMRRGLKTGHLVAGGFVIGVLVTILESICTGQVYVPTLVMIIRSGHSTAHAMTLLTAFNLMFVLPLVIILFVTWRGMQSVRLAEWSRRNVVISKCLLGILFLSMTALLWVL